MNFQLIFKALTDYEPLRWQERLYTQMRAGRLPDVCDLPTGLGKTSVIPIWLIAFASEIEAGQHAKLPRRLIYIVNRRTVVDQATVLAEKLRERIQRQNGKISDPSDPLDWLITALARARANSNGPVLAISTLRGELADNEEWKSDPARPAIIVGTIDMIGSKLLFAGYGDSYRLRPHHAGLIGQDALIIHDEAHLTPAFNDLLQAVAREQHRCKESRSVAVLELSATASDTPNREVFSLQPELDEQDALVRQRLNAQKALHLHEGDTLSLQETIVELALKHQTSACKVLIYVRSPETARKVVDLLKKDLGTNVEERVDLLTGTIRGHERDRMVKDKPVYQALLNPDRRVEQTLYLISTSAGEVGIDLDADHMVCDLTTLDAMIQRLGRVNRRGGEGRTARVDMVVASAKKGKKKKESDEDAQAPLPFEQALSNTHSALKRLPQREDGGYDAGPLTLRKLLAEAKDAVAPQPPTVPLTDILLDGWALTSIREGLPGQPGVAAYLHGLTDDVPETYVAWRAEIPLLAKAGVSPELLQEWFKHCRIEARERLRDTTVRVRKELQALAERHSLAALPVVVLTERGEAELFSLHDVLKRGQSALAFRTIVLPAEAGGLTDEGLLDGKAKKRVLDVAEAGKQRSRLILQRTGETYQDWPLSDDDTSEDERDKPSPATTHPSPERAVAQIARRYRWSSSQLIPLGLPPEGEEDDAEQRYLLLLVEPKRAVEEAPESASLMKQPTVDEHCQLAEQWAARFADMLALDELQKQALTTAARWHDRGKDRKVWQRAIFNESATAYAKSGPRGMDGRLLGGYRHELGSLLEAAADDQISHHPEADLILHLIAVHHGWARPQFMPNAWDERHTEAQNEQAVLETMRRFGRLQQRFGRWGLAWLECLMRCTDVLASHQVAVPNDAPTPQETNV